MLSQMDGPPVKVANKQLPVSNLQALIDKIDNPDGKGLKASTVQKAIREIQVLSGHPNTTAAQKKKFATLTTSLHKMMELANPSKVTGEYAYMGLTAPGLPMSFLQQFKNLQKLTDYLYINNDADHYQWFFVSPLGVYTTDATQFGGSITDNSHTAQQTAFNELFIQVRGAMTDWIKANGLEGSGNVQSAEDKTGMSKFNLSSASSDGWGGFLTGLSQYGDFASLVSNPNFQVHNQTALQKIEKSAAAAVKAVAKDVSTAAKDVVKEASTIAKGVEHVVALVAASPARLAAIELIKANDMNLATMLAQAWQKDKSKVSNFWYTFGGSPSELVKAINQGAHTSLSGQTDYMLGDVTPTPKSATASAIVNAIIAFLRSMGIPIPPVVQDTVNKWLDKAATVLKQGATTVAIIAHNIDGTPPSAGVFKKEMVPTGKGVSPILLVGGAAVLGFIFLSDK